MAKFSISTPDQMADDLDYLSGRLGFTRSALLTSMLSETLRELRVILEELPDQPTPDDVRRFRGSSVDVITSKVKNLKSIGAGDDLFSDL